MIAETPSVGRHQTEPIAPSMRPRSYDRGNGSSLLRPGVYGPPFNEAAII